MVRAKGVVLVWGIPRSGTTLVYNLARFALESASVPGLVSGWDGDLHKRDIGEFYLIKTHEPPNAVLKAANKTIFTYRDPRDSLVSVQRKFGDTPTLEMARWYVDICQRGIPKADLVLRFETMTSDVGKTARHVIDTLELDVDPDSVVASLPPSDTSPGNGEGYDPVTLMHGGHRTGTASGAWRNTLPLELQNDIARELGPAIAKLGYET